MMKPSPTYYGGVMYVSSKPEERKFYLIRFQIFAVKSAVKPGLDSPLVVERVFEALADI
jgi:hypothetical protein